MNNNINLKLWWKKLAFMFRGLYLTAAHNELVATEARLRSKDNENRELRHAIEEATGREAGEYGH